MRQLPLRRIALFLAICLLAPIAAAAAGGAMAQAPDERELEVFELQGRAEEAQSANRLDEAAEYGARALALAEALDGPDGDLTTGPVIVLARIHESRGALAEAERFYRRWAESAERASGPDHPDTIAGKVELGLFYVRHDRHAEAEPVYLEAVEASQRALGSEDPATISAQNGLGVLYLRQGRFAAAEPLLVEAVRGIEALFGPDDEQTLVAVDNLASAYQQQGRLAEAAPLVQRVFETSVRLGGDEDPHTLVAADNLASLYQRLGRLADAEPLVRKTLAISERILGRDHPETLVTANNLAVLLQAQGRTAEASPLYARVLEASDRVLGAVHADTIDAAASLARFRLGSATERGGALAPARQLVASLRARRATLAADGYAEAQRERERARAGAGFTLLADAAWEASQTSPADRPDLVGEVLTALQDAAAGTTSRAMIRMAARRQAGARSAELGRLAEQRDASADRWTSNSRRFDESLAARGPDAVALRQTLAIERRRIEEEMATIDAALERDFPEYFALIRPEAVDLAELQAALAPDEALLLVVPADFGTHVLAVSRTDSLWQRSDWRTPEVSQAVGRLVRDIQATMADRGFRYDRQTAHELYREVVAPAEPVLAGKRHVFVASAGALTSIPFGILVTTPPQGDDADPETLRRTSWFADAHALVQIASVQSWLLLRQAGARATGADPSGPAFLGFGNPTLEGPRDRPEACARGGAAETPTVAAVASTERSRLGGMRADGAQLRRLCPLPATTVELESLRAAFDAPSTALFLGQQATEGRFRTMDLSGTRILALATHGLVAGELDGGSEPGLVFTPPATATDDDDGFVTTSEVSALRLDADWVILSACNTAAGDGSAGAPGLSGLARAFFHAGARSLLASHWNVVDAAAPRLTAGTIRLMTENPGMSRAEALQAAMRDVRASPEQPAWAHPGVWAAFSLIGDAGT